MTAPARIPTPEDFPASGPNSLAFIAHRGIARTIDELLLFVPFFLASLPFLRLEDGRLDGDIPWWFTALQVTAGLLYEVVLLVVWGRTVGKFLLGLRVARYTDGAHPDVTQAFLRVLLATAVGLVADAIVPGLGIVVVPLLYLTALRDPLRRGWHDYAGGTVVVRAR